MGFTHYVVFTPNDRFPADFSGHAAQADYGVSPENGSLLKPPTLSRAELLIFHDAVAIPNGAGLAQALADEAVQRNADGIYLDFERPPTPTSIAFIQTLETAASGLRLLVPLPYFPCTVRAEPVYSWRPEDGAFRRQLLRRQKEFSRPLWLEYARVCRQVRLSKQAAVCSEVSFDTPAALQRNSIPTLFSPELLCRYASVPDNSSVTLYLYDTKDTFRQKLELAQSLNLGGVLTLRQEFL